MASAAAAASGLGLGRTPQINDEAGATEQRFAGPGSYFVVVSNSRIPPSDAITPLVSYGRNTIF